MRLENVKTQLRAILTLRDFPMNQPKQFSGKATLDKDLGKISHFEEAAQHVARSLVRPGIGLMFVLLAVLLASAFTGEHEQSLIIASAAVLGAYMAINIGANDVTNNVGPAVGAKAMSMTTALVVAAVFEIAGALIAGGNVVETISTGIIDPSQIPQSSAFMWAMMAALLAAAIWVNFSTWMGAPVSTTHSIVGGVLGAGVAASSFHAVNWASVGGITASWVFSPLFGGFFAMIFLAFIKEFIIDKDDKIAAARKWVPLLLALMAGSFAAYLSFEGLNRLFSVPLKLAVEIGFVVGLLSWIGFVPLVDRQAIGLENRNQSLKKLFRLPLIFSAALLSFAHGANDVSNAIGPLSAIVYAARGNGIAPEVQVPLWVMIIGAFGISAGLLLFGPRLIRIVGGEITKLNPVRAFCVALSAAFTVQVASGFGIPVSSTHIAVGGVFGVGFYREWYTNISRRRVHEEMQAKADGGNKPVNAQETSPEEMRRRYLVRRSHFMTIMAAWVITLPATASLAAGIYEILAVIFI